MTLTGGMARTPNDLDKLWSQIVKDDCWIWTGCVNKKSGYGSFSYQNKPHNTHVFVYELLVGPVPEGRELHHNCRNRRCCNPNHLEPLTRSEHRKLEPHTNGNEKRTHCPAGHPYDEANTGRYNGRRHCRACARNRYYRKVLS